MFIFKEKSDKDKVESHNYDCVMFIFRCPNVLMIPCLSLDAHLREVPRHSVASHRVRLHRHVGFLLSHHGHRHGRSKVTFKSRYIWFCFNQQLIFLFFPTRPECQRSVTKINTRTSIRGWVGTVFLVLPIISSIAGIRTLEAMALAYFIYVYLLVKTPTKHWKQNFLGFVATDFPTVFNSTSKSNLNHFFQWQVRRPVFRSRCLLRVLDLRRLRLRCFPQVPRVESRTISARPKGRPADGDQRHNLLNSFLLLGR